MRSITRIAVLLSAFLGFQLQASDACEQRSITAAASVEVSDGSSFATQSYYQSPEFAAIHHIRENKQWVVAEGPLAWFSRSDKPQLGGQMLKQFALGHQFHALLLDFEQMVSDIRDIEELQFRGAAHRGRSGAYPHGGELILVHEEGERKPAGMVMMIPETPRMEITFGDWREQGGMSLPFHVEIDDGQQVFKYSYSEVKVGQASPLWFFEAVKAPDIDRLQVYRLHRSLLAAHCLGDADRLADLSTEEGVNSNRGVLSSVAREDMRSRFSGLFAKIDYLHYEDIADPVIEVSSSGDIGWAAVNVRARGVVKDGGQAFDDQWSWIMLAKKVDGQWLHAGNASNRLPRPD